MSAGRYLSDQVPPFVELGDTLGGGAQVEPNSRSGIGQYILPGTPLAGQAGNGGLDREKTVFEITRRGVGHCQSEQKRGIDLVVLIDLDVYEVV